MFYSCYFVHFCCRHCYHCTSYGAIEECLINWSFGYTIVSHSPSSILSGEYMALNLKGSQKKGHGNQMLQFKKM